MNVTLARLETQSGRLLYEGTPSEIQKVINRYIAHLPLKQRLGLISNCSKTWTATIWHPTVVPRRVARDFEDWLTLDTLANL